MASHAGSKSVPRGEWGAPRIHPLRLRRFKFMEDTYE